MYPFRMYGRTVEIHRFQVSYTQERFGESNEVIREAVSTYCHTQKEARDSAEQVNGQVMVLDATDYEWMDGLEVADVPDTYAAAVEIYEMGREAWECKAAFEESKKADQLRADLDYVMLMGGL